MDVCEVTRNVRGWDEMEKGEEKLGCLDIDTLRSCRIEVKASSHSTG